MPKNAEKRKKRKKRLSVAQRQNKILVFMTTALVLLTVAVFVYVGVGANFSMQEFLMPNQTTLPSNGVISPTEKYIDKTNFLIIGTSDDKKTLRYFIVVKTDMETGTQTICSLPTDAKIGEGTLSTLFVASGSDAVANSLMDAYGIYIDKYITIKDSNFKKLVQKTGNVIYSFADDIKFSTSGDDAYSLRIKQGEQKLNGETILKLFRYSGENIKDFKLQNEIVASSINQILSPKTFDSIEQLFKSAINLVETDITVKDFTEKLGALQYACNENFDFSTQIVQIEGTATDNGFEVSEKMSADMKKMFYKED